MRRMSLATKNAKKLRIRTCVCEITPTREIVHVCFVAESFYTIYTFYTAEINPCFTMADYICP